MPDRMRFLRAACEAVKLRGTLLRSRPRMKSLAASRPKQLLAASRLESSSSSSSPSRSSSSLVVEAYHTKYVLLLLVTLILFKNDGMRCHA